MKTRIAFFALVWVAATAVAQEYDDMYFTSKDRAKISATRSPQVTNTNRTADNSDLVQSKINPTDSYSGRGVNPEYTAQTKFNSTNTEEAPQYFVSSYIPANVNPNLNQYSQGSFNTPYYGNNYSNCNCGNNSFYNNPYYGYGGMSGFGSPYSSFYGGGFNPGWSSMLGYMWGGMGSGMYGGMNYGFGNMWGSPSSMFWNNYYGMNSYYGGYYNPFNSYYGGGYGFNSYYPRSVVILNDNTMTSHRRRAERSSTGNNYVNTNSRTTNTGGTYTRNGRMISSTGNTGGRQSTGDSSPYFNRSWRNNSQGTTTNSGRSSFWSNGNNSGNSRGSWSNGNNGNNSNWSTPSRSSWSNSNFGGGSRSGGSFSGGGHSSGGGGGGHSRGGRGN
jgi:hypothetical protein